VIDGLYSAAGGMNAQQNRMNAISVDLANLSTTGYKSQHFGFQELLYQIQGPNRAITGQGTGSGVVGGVLDRAMTQGAINGTNNPLDLAIEGGGFFQVRLTDGTTGFTRAGDFTLDAQRRIATPDGNILVPSITVPINISLDSIGVAPDGVVTAGSTRLGQIQIATFAAPERLTSLGANLYAASNNSGPAGTANPGIIQQRALEGSNTDTSQSLTDMIQAQRAYDLCSRAVRTWDEMLQTANQIRR